MPMPPQPGTTTLSSDGKRHATLLGGLLIMLVNTVPYMQLLNLVFLAGIFFSGLIALNRTILRYQIPITSVQAFFLGSTAGLLGAFFSETASTLLISLFSYQPGKESLDLLFGMMVDMARERPELQKQVNELMAARDSATQAIFSIQAFISTITIGAIFYMPVSGLGGATAVWLLKRQARRSRRK